MSSRLRSSLFYHWFTSERLKRLWRWKLMRLTMASTLVGRESTRGLLLCVDPVRMAPAEWHRKWIIMRHNRFGAKGRVVSPPRRDHKTPQNIRGQLIEKNDWASEYIKIIGQRRWLAFLEMAGNNIIYSSVKPRELEQRSAERPNPLRAYFLLLSCDEAAAYIDTTLSAEVGFGWSGMDATCPFLALLYTFHT